MTFDKNLHMIFVFIVVEFMFFSKKGIRFGDNDALIDMGDVNDVGNVSIGKS